MQLSGGEPTLHPDFFAILDATKARPIRHLMVNTNGIRLAQEPEFASQLAKYKPGIEIYLQFDSLRADTLQDLRGADLRHIREQALDALDRHNLSTTLVMTLEKGVNDDEIGDIIRYALTRPSVAEQSGLFSLDDIVPVPCNPDTLAMGTPSSWVAKSIR